MAANSKRPNVPRAQIYETESKEFYLTKHGIDRQSKNENTCIKQERKFDLPSKVLIW